MHAGDHEDELRAHIREQLLDYALTHLTENYVTFTENTVAGVRLLTHNAFAAAHHHDVVTLTMPF